jgi:hypothetical protein
MGWTAPPHKTASVWARMDLPLPGVHHLLVTRDRVRVVRGPQENGVRPAIDPLFRAAAAAYGPRVLCGRSAGRRCLRAAGAVPGARVGVQHGSAQRCS